MSMYCCYKDCPNMHRPFCNKPFFNLPTDARRDVWIKNSGQEDPTLDWSKRKMFCEDHFDPKYLRRQFNRTTLRKDAVPYIYSAETNEIEFIECEESEDEAETAPSEKGNACKEQENNKQIIIVLEDSHVKKKARMELKKDKVLNPGINSQPTTQTKTNNDTDEVNIVILSGEATSNDSTGFPRQSHESESREVEIISCKQRHSFNDKKANEKSSQNLDISSASTNDKSANHADLLVSSSEKTDSNKEETYFALSLVGILCRLPPQKRAIAKCHILNYLTELEYGSSSDHSN